MSLMTILNRIQNSEHIYSPSFLYTYRNLQIELATQISTECEKLVPNQCVTLVGGIAIVKQKRLLSTKKPSVIVATPGRLWAMVGSKLAHLYSFGVDEEKMLIRRSIIPI